MANHDIQAAFWYDAGDELLVARFPEDFQDWLLDEGREDDAREFMARWKQLESVMSHSEQLFDYARDLAEEYATVREFNEESRTPARKTYEQMFNLLRDLESADEPNGDDEPLSWDREAALVNRAIADMPEPERPVLFEDDEDDEHVYPIAIYVRHGTPVLMMFFQTARALVNGGYSYGKDDLLYDFKSLLRQPEVTHGEIFDLLWHYVDIRPEEDEPDMTANWDW